MLSCLLCQALAKFFCSVSEAITPQTGPSIIENEHCCTLSSFLTSSWVKPGCQTGTASSKIDPSSSSYFTYSHILEKIIMLAVKYH